MCVPYLHGLRWWSTISCSLVFIFCAIIFGVSIHDGMSMFMQAYSVQSSVASHTQGNVSFGASSFGVSILDGVKVL